MVIYLHKYEEKRSRNLVFFGETLNGNTNVEIVIDQDVFEDRFYEWSSSMARKLNFAPYAHPEQEYDFAKHQTMSINNRWLQEVIIYGKSRKKIEFNEETFINAQRAPKDLFSSASRVRDIIDQMGLNVQHETELLYFVNDIREPAQYVSTLWTEDIEALYIVKFPDVMMYQLSDSWGTDINANTIVISIHLKSLQEQKDFHRRSNSIVLPQLGMTKEFYSPMYNTDALRYSQVPDLRKTIHWAPEIIIDEKGEAEIFFYNGDRYTQVRCVLEGISDNGVPVRREFTYNVNTIRE